MRLCVRVPFAILLLSALRAHAAPVKNPIPFWFNDADDRATVYFLSSNDLPVGAFLAIFGDDFGTSGQVQLGSVVAPVASWSTHRIVVTIPAGATGPVRVQPSGSPASDPFPVQIRAGRVLHLSASAPSGGNGSAANPWNNFGTADSAIGPGDFVVIHGGTYGGSGEYAWDFNKSGSSGNTITWFVAPGEVALVDGATVSKIALRVDASWINVVGLVARGSLYQNIFLNAANSRVIDCEAREGNGAVSTKGQGININGTASKALGNYVHDNYSHGFYAYATDMEIAYNYVSNSGCCGAPTSYGYGIQLFVVDPGPTYTHARVYRNLVTNSNRSGIVVGQYSDGADVYENILRGNDERGIFVGYGARNTRIRNNVFYQNDTDAAGYHEVELDIGTSAEFVNNVVVGSRAVSRASSFGGTLRIDFNNYFGSTSWRWNGTSYGTFGSWRTASGADSASFTTDPRFRDAASSDFRPGAGSPLINTGDAAACARPIIGAACEIGAFETLDGSSQGGLATPQNLRRTDRLP